MHLQRFLDRLITGASFAAYTRLLQVLGNADHAPVSLSVHAPSLPGPLLLVGGLVPLAIAGMMCTARLRGLQTVFAMIAGQGITQLIPMPAEPSGYLMVPSVLLYFAFISAAGAALQQVLFRLVSVMGSDAGDPIGLRFNDTIAALFQQYVDLFAITRAFITFQSAGQERMLAVVSLVYLALPPSMAPGNFLSTFANDARTPLLWGWHLVNCIENLVARGAMLWISRQLSAWGSGKDTRLAMHLLAVYATSAYHRPPRPPDEDEATDKTKKETLQFDAVTYTDKLLECHSTLSLLSAQQGLQLLSQLRGGTSAVIMAALVALIKVLLSAGSRQGGKEDEHMFEDVCAFGLSLLLSKSLQQFLDGACLLEAGCTYLCVFALLECLRSDAWSNILFSATPAQGASGGLMLQEGDGDYRLLFF